MKSKVLIFFWLFFVWNLFAGNQNGGKTGLSFLKIAIDARAVGMGEAYTAVSSDASATYWNPAGLLNATGSNVIFHHNEWIEDIRGEFAAISFIGKSSAWAFHIRSFNLGEIQVREIPTTEPLGKTSAHYLSAGISYSRRLRTRLDVGITVKYLFEKIYVESASGYALDVGLLYRPNISHLRFAATVQNLGKMNRLKNEPSNLPELIRLGMFYEIPWSFEKFQTHIAFDLVKQQSENLKVHLGAEAILFKQLALRGGSMFGYETHDFSFGIGILRSSIRFDYAITPFSQNLGVAHRFSVNFFI